MRTQGNSEELGGTQETDEQPVERDMEIAATKKGLPEEFKSFEEIQDFWDANSSADFWDQMEEVELQLSPALKSKLKLKKLYRLRIEDSLDE
jgi:hypothetical protein